MTASQPPLWTRALVIVSATLFLGAMVPNLFILSPRFLGDLGYDEQQIGRIMGAFNITSLAMVPAISRLTTRLGHARVLAVGALITSGGALVFALSDAQLGFAVGRAIQGIGFAGVLVGAGSYVAETAPLDRMGQALGIAGVLTLTAQAVGPALGEALVPLGWDWVFGAAVACGVAGGAVALVLPPVPHRAAGDVDAASSSTAVLIATALAGLGFGAIWSFLADYVRQVGLARTTLFFVPYVASAVSTRLFLGTLSDRIGRRQAAAPALVGHVVALLVMSQLHAAWQLVTVGLLYGLCHGVYYPTLQAMVVERSGGKRSRAVASSTFAFGLGAAIAAFGLGPVARSAGYPTIYAIAAAAGAVAAALVAWRPKGVA